MLALRASQYELHVVTHRFGTLELDVPPKWSDQSVITLVREFEERPGLARMPELRKSFVVTRAPFDGTFTVEELAHTHLAALRAQILKLELVREDMIEIDGTPAYTREIRFPTPQHGLAQQLHVFMILGDKAYTMVGIGSAGISFDSTRLELLEIIKSFKVRSG